MTLARLMTVLFCALTLGLSAQARDGPVAGAPAALDFRLGSLQLTALRGGRWQADNDGGVFGVNAGPGAVAAVLAQAGAPTAEVTLDVDALLVRLPGRMVLIDAGLGPADHGVILGSLALAGVRPSDITDVLVTHAHGDHVDGLVGEGGTPVFPKAVVRMSAREWAAMRANKWEAATARAIAPQVKVFEPGAEILPGVTPIALYGDTPGHVGYQIVSGGARLIDIGDVAHSSIISLARPDWTIDFDEDRAAGARVRQAELARLAVTHERVFAPHFPFPGIGYVVKAGKGFRWAPALDK